LIACKIDADNGKLTKLKEYPMGKNPNWVAETAPGHAIRNIISGSESKFRLNPTPGKAQLFRPSAILDETGVLGSTLRSRGWNKHSRTSGLSFFCCDTSPNQPCERENQFRRL